MNILYIDIDSLRPDHLGCYGYHRRTSPNIDRLAQEGLRFTNCYVPDAPCLPSRTAMTTGRFGIHTGVVDHGGIAAQPFHWGRSRGFRCSFTEPNWASQLQESGYHTVGFSPFAQRHGAWHWYAGFSEVHNTGGRGMETADRISPLVESWLDREVGSEKPFFMWLNVWDPHTPYRTPKSFDCDFSQDPLPAWYSEDVRRAHWMRPGPHSPQEFNGYIPECDWMFNYWGKEYPEIHDRQPMQISNMDEARRMFDGYDLGVAHADHHVGRIVDKLKELGIYDETAIIISADHGENLGELWVYGDHQTADYCTNRVPMIVRWPGVTDSRAGQSDDRLIYSLDAAAATLELAGLEVPKIWDGESIAPSFSNPDAGPRRDFVVLSQAAWCVQRSARWDDYLLIHTFHDAYRDYPEFMLFNVAEDPHEQHNLAESRPELVAKGREILATWKEQAMATSRTGVDPMDTVLAEGSAYHVRSDVLVPEKYIARLRDTGRDEAADRFAERMLKLGGSK